MSKKLSIDGPAGRNEVNDKYRSNYGDTFNAPLISKAIAKELQKNIPKKSKQDGGKHARKKT